MYVLAANPITIAVAQIIYLLRPVVDCNFLAAEIVPDH